MSTQPLLYINPEKLFEENGIDKIKTIQIQIQNEIEKKREELRTMVGERYRDLLKAADTITEMRETSENVIQYINRTENLCKDLQQKRLSGLMKDSQKKPLGKESEHVGDISKIIEIKLLLSLPEQIWIAIDNKNYLLGAELFLFATHIYLSINVSPNAKIINEEYPVVSKQWDIITSYRNIIANCAQNQLKVIDLSHEKAAECLTSIMFLDVVPYEKLIVQYLNLRMMKLQEILHSEEVSRKKLGLIVLLLQHTIITVYHCFYVQPNQMCSIERAIQDIVGSSSKSTLGKTPQAISLPDHYLSPLVKNFRPSIKKEQKCLTKENISQILESWLNEINNVLKLQLTKLLMLMDNIRRLHKIIKEDVLSIEYPAQWKTIIATLLSVTNLNIYDCYMKNLVTSRIMVITDINLQNCISDVTSVLKDVDEEISKERGKHVENDIRWFVWKENIMDSHEYLRLKTQGYTNRVMKLCNCLEKGLKELLDDVELVVGENNAESEFLNILLYLNKRSFEMLKSLTKKIVESCKLGDAMVTESGIIVRARFLQSLITQSPSLEKCLRQGQKESLKQLSENDMLNAWSDASSHLNEESTRIWTLWKEVTIAKLSNLIKSKLSARISLRTLLASKPLNEVVNIEEHTEDGTKVMSDIRVPSQPSLPLQDLLFQACQLLNAVVPHTLPRKIHQSVVDTFVKNILEHYEEWSRSETIYQSQAWQLLMDVRLIALLLITHENKTLSQSLCETFERIIDPFDLDVHYPYLQNCVKKSTQRLQATMGILINHREKLPVFNGLKLTQNASTIGKVEEPNILAVSDKVPWFALLPVATHSSETAPVSKESTPEKVVRSKEKESRKESKSRDFVRSANAFLNAMTSRWS